jgi:hypothetical protein
MNKKLGPYFLLGFLFVILVFIVGVKYGKRVESTNKVIDFALSIPPTKPPTPTVPISFKTLTNKGCGVQFLYPETLKVATNSTEEAALKDGAAAVVQINCRKTNDLEAMVTGNKLATEEIKLKSQTLKARTDPEDSSHKLYFQIKNASNRKQIYVGIDKNVYPLFESTLQYLP